MEPVAGGSEAPWLSGAQFLSVASIFAVPASSGPSTESCWSPLHLHLTLSTLQIFNPSSRHAPTLCGIRTKLQASHDCCDNHRRNRAKPNTNKRTRSACRRCAAGRGGYLRYCFDFGTCETFARLMRMRLMSKPRGQVPGNRMVQVDLVPDQRQERNGENTRQSCWQCNRLAPKLINHSARSKKPVSSIFLLRTRPWRPWASNPHACTSPQCGPDRRGDAADVPWSDAGAAYRRWGSAHAPIRVQISN